MKGSQKSNKNFQIHLSLNRKYDLSFNFFKVKDLNQIVYRKDHSVSYIKFQDLFDLASPNEYLRRYYFLSNSEGSREIFLRIKWLIKYYQTHRPIMNFEYPTMFVTRTFEIFILRLRRIHKLNISTHSDLVKLSRWNKSTVYYLKSQNTPESSSENSFNIMEKSLIKSGNFELSFDNSTYNIYGSFYGSEEQSEDRSLINQLRQDKQNNSLVLNFQDIDFLFLNKAIAREKKMKRRPFSPKISKTQTRLVENSEEEEFHPISIQNNLFKDTQNYLSHRQKYFEDHYVRKYGLYQLKETGTTKNESKPLEKGKMKQKAKDLLNRLTKQDYLGPHLDQDK